MLPKVSGAISMKASMSDYGYINARIRGMKSCLLDRSFYERLIKIEDLNSVISELERTPYKKEFDECVAREQVEPLDIDEALKRNLARTFRKILSFMKDEPRKLTGVLLARWDVHNLKSILRGKHIGATEEEIDNSLIPGGEIDIPFLAELAKQPDVKSAIDLMVTWDLPYAKPLKKSLPQYLKAMKEGKLIAAENGEDVVGEAPSEIESIEENLSILESALDKSYYRFALRNTRDHTLNSRIVRELIISQIDTTNILTLLQIQHIDFQREYAAVEDDKERAERIIEKKREFFIPKGKELRFEQFLAMSEEIEVEDIIRQLSHTSYGLALQQVMPRFYDLGSLAILQRKMEEIALKKGLDMNKKGPLSMGVIAAYIWAKFNEVVNLRIIIRGKAIGMLERRIREELLLV